MGRGIGKDKLWAVVTIIFLCIALVVILLVEKGDKKADADTEKKSWLKTEETETDAEEAKDKDTSSKAEKLSKEEVEKLATEMLADMTLKEKVYQMMLVRPESITGVKTVVAAGEATKKALKDHPVGGLIYFEQNMQSREQISTVISNTQTYSEIPLFIAVDEEGGTVSRVSKTLGTTKLKPMYTYREEGKKTAEKNAETIAKDIKGLGFNLDFAPVADVWSNNDNQVIGKRAYSDDFKQAAELVGAAVEGFKKEGIACTLKHFPGHGDTVEDSHTEIAYTSKTIKEMRKEEFKVFKAGIKAGADFVMMGHIMVEKLGVPASMSETMIQDILREELKFEGIVITDSLEMAAVSEEYTGLTDEEIIVKAVLAGNDMLLLPKDVKKAVDAIEKAVEEEEIDEERIDKSVHRILRKKIELGLITTQK